MSTGKQAVSDDAPIFIVGNGRSGTTLLRLMLSAHPRIYICHELMFYQWEHDFCPPKIDGSTFLRHYFRTYGYRWLRQDPASVLAKLPSRIERKDVAIALREIMKQKAESLGRVRYGDKTPIHVNHLKRIFRDFPNARVVVTARDPRTNVPSYTRMPFGSSKDLANCLTYAGARRAAWRFKDRIHIVRLEDLQADPRGTMAKVLDFVGEDWSEDVLDHANHSPDRDDMPEFPWFTRSTGPLDRTPTSTSDMSPRRIRLIETMTQQSMRAYGYEKATLPSEPGRLRISLDILSQIPETLRFWAAEIRMALYVRNPEHWEYEDEGARERFRRINPQAWRDSQITFAEAPDWRDRNALASSAPGGE